MSLNMAYDRKITITQNVVGPRRRESNLLSSDEKIILTPNIMF